ncbi:MAG: protoporphyrinogen/coproporphyrinogen oxidase [Actinomycetota bacterium]|nr:protoporphyrinogen/coproporphyrinogen oxidase [Actinomycetota bacterium]
MNPGAPPGPVVVVGGGIAGLTAALELAERGAAVTLVEAGDCFGGKIATSRVDGLVVEAGADSFLSSKPAGLALCERLGITDRLVNSRAEDRRTFVWSRGRLRELPEGLVLGSPARAWSLLRSGLLSPVGAARMVGDMAVPRRRSGSEDGRGGPAPAEETVAEFFTRRLGGEAYARVVEPLLAGIHAGDATRLSLPATFPRFVDMERDHGGLVRAALAGRVPKPVRRLTAMRRRGQTGVPFPLHPGRRTPVSRAAAPAAGVVGAVPAGHTPFVSFRTGMAEVVEALAARLGALGVHLRTGQAVAGIGAVEGGYEVVLGGTGEALPAAAVVLATPAPVTARLVRSLCPAAAVLLEGIEHASTATVSLAYRSDDVGTPPEGYGFVVPRAEGRHLLAGTWGSNKWPGRAPAGEVLLRGYVGGVGREAVLEADDDGLVHLVRAELRALAGIRGTPVHSEVHRYPDGMPQYTVGHLGRVERIRGALAACPGLAVTGAAYGGVGIPDCIADALATVGHVLRSLGQ